METESESSYQSVADENDEGNDLIHSTCSIMTPELVRDLDPTNGENLESTILTSHSSPDKANRPRASSLRSKTRFHDYVAEEHRYPPVIIKR